MSVDEEEMNWQKLLQRRLWRFPNSTRFFRLLLRCVHPNIMLKISLEEHAGPQAYWHVNQGQVGRRIVGFFRPKSYRNTSLPWTVATRYNPQHLTWKSPASRLMTSTPSPAPDQEISTGLGMTVFPAIKLLKHQAGVGHLQLQQLKCEKNTVFSNIVFKWGNSPHFRSLSTLTPLTNWSSFHPWKTIRNTRLLKSFATEVVAAFEHRLPPLIRVQEELQRAVGLRQYPLLFSMGNPL